MMKAWLEVQGDRVDDNASGGNTCRRISAKMPSFATRSTASLSNPRGTLIMRIFFVGVFALTTWLPSKAQAPNPAPRRLRISSISQREPE